MCVSVCVWVCLCVYIRMHVCVYVPMYVMMCVYVHIRTRNCMRFPLPYQRTQWQARGLVRKEVEVDGKFL